MNIEKSSVFLYTNNKLSEKLRKQSHLLYNCIKKNKIPRNT